MSGLPKCYSSFFEDNLTFVLLDRGHGSCSISLMGCNVFGISKSL